MNSLGRKNNDNKKEQLIFTKETLGVVLILFATLSLVCLITNDKVFSVPGAYVRAFLLGVFGYFSFALEAGLIALGVYLVVGKKKGRLDKRSKTFLSLLAVTIIFLIHSITASGISSLSYGEYLAACYNNGANIAVSTFGGVVTGIFGYWFSKILSNIGCYAVFGILTAVFGYFSVKAILDYNKKGAVDKANKIRSSFVKEETSPETFAGMPDTSVIKDYPVSGVDFSEQATGFNSGYNASSSKQKLFVGDGAEFAFKSKRDLKSEENTSGLKVDMVDGKLGVVRTEGTFAKSYGDDMKSKLEYIKTPAKYDFTSKLGNKYGLGSYGRQTEKEETVSVSKPIPVVSEKPEAKPEVEIPLFEHDESKEDNTAIAHAKDFADKYAVEDINSEFNTDQSAPEESFRPLSGGVEANEAAGGTRGFGTEVKADTGKEVFSDKNTVDEHASDGLSFSERNASERENFRERDEINNKSEDNFGSDENMESARSSGSDSVSDSSIVKGRRIRDIFLTDDEKRKAETTDIRGFGSRNNAVDEERTGVDRSPNAVPSVDLTLSESERNVNADRAEDSSERKTFDGERSAMTERTRSLDTFRSLNVDRAESNAVSNAPSISGSERQEPKTEPKKEKVIPPIGRTYYRPPLDLLGNYSSFNVEPENHQERMEIIKETLESFHITVEPQNYIQGPTITRYEIKMPSGIPVRKVLNYDNDLRMWLSAKDGVRIEAPIPGKNLVGVEVANTHKTTVGLRSVMEGVTKPFKEGSLMFALGKNIIGEAVFDDLAKGPHYLVAGTTGSGKSVCLNIMIVSLIMRYSPEQLRLILVDPKGNEFVPYEHLPHLLTDEIIKEPKRALSALNWAKEEMERRYKTLEEAGGIRDIVAYNESIKDDKTKPRMPRIVIIVDELSNLMESCKKDMEPRIISIAQKARAVGIHLVLATQRPSVDVITGLLKANLPSRIALKVTNFADSSTILGGIGGAEKLLGNGDMLFKNSTMNDYERYQGAFISDSEINNIVSFIRERNKAYFDDDLAEYLENADKPEIEELPSADSVSGMFDGNAENEDLFKRALALGVLTETISISQLQRRFGIGWGRAGRIIDKMEKMKFVPPSEGAKARKMLMTREMFEQQYGVPPESVE